MELLYIFVPVELMKSRKINRRILYLMIVSQILLTVFVLYWIRSQYSEEKKRLADELTSLYIEAQDEMVDTVLFKNYVGPVLSGTNDSLPFKNSRPEGAAQWKGGNNRVIVRVNHTSDSLTSGSDTLRLRNANEDMLIRSVKLIISHSRDTLKSDVPLVKSFGFTPDTSAFMNHFHHRLDEAGLKFNIMWISDSSGSGNFRKTIYLAPLNPFSLPAVNVRNYSGYLSARILPQALFGALLICLTALAFMISYRSLRNQALFSSMREEFISNMTHELKTPVSSISLALESLGKYNLRTDPAIMDEYLKLALSETQRLEDLVNRVLDHTVLEENIRGMNLITTDINQLTGDVISIMKPRLKDKGIIEFCPSEERLMVNCDVLLLKGVIMNLIDNSIKYAGELPEIKLFTGKHGKYAKITVNDNGPGIPPEYHDKIFEKFFRVPTGDIHNVKGYGLGLSFAARVVALHKGTISINNREKGCSFILQLPLA